MEDSVKEKKPRRRSRHRRALKILKLTRKKSKKKKQTSDQSENKAMLDSESEALGHFEKLHSELDADVPPLGFNVD